MKLIAKKEQPAELQEWIAQFLSMNGRNPTYKDFRGTSEWTNLRAELLSEQGYICCYCMARIEDWSSHIEHFVPRVASKLRPHAIDTQDLELSYDNMLMSCNGEHGDGAHCGRCKDCEDSPMLLSPTDPAIEEVFTYGIDGSIDGTSPEAMTSIRILNLNTLQLRRHRRSAIHMSELFEDTGRSTEDAIFYYGSKDLDGYYSPFCMSVIYCLKNYPLS